VFCMYIWWKHADCAFLNQYFSSWHHFAKPNIISLWLWLELGSYVHINIHNNNHTTLFVVKCEATRISVLQLCCILLLLVVLWSLCHVRFSVVKSLLFLLCKCLFIFLWTFTHKNWIFFPFSWVDFYFNIYILYL